MNSEVFDFKNYTLKISCNIEDSPHAILMLHGFPAEKLNDTVFEKNLDLANFLASKTKDDVFLPHYNGLGKNHSSEFNFVHSIEDSIQLTEKLLSIYSSISIVGHSWGGLVAINCFGKFHSKIRKMVLLSPLTLLLDDHNLKPILEGLIEEIPKRSRSKAIEEYLKEFEMVRQRYAPFNVLHDVGDLDRVSIIQAKKDHETPSNFTESFITKFGYKILYSAIETDHSFMENRGDVMSRVLSLLKKDNLDFF